MSDLFANASRHAPVGVPPQQRYVRRPASANLYRNSGAISAANPIKSPQQSVYDYTLQSLDNPEIASLGEQKSGFFSPLFRQISAKLALEMVDTRSSLSRVLLGLRNYYIQNGRSDLAKNFPEDLRREAFVIHNAYETGKNDDTHVMRLGVLIGKLKKHIYTPVTQDFDESERLKLADDFLQTVERGFRHLLTQNKKNIIAGQISNPNGTEESAAPVKNNLPGKFLLL